MSTDDKDKDVRDANPVNFADLEKLARATGRPIKTLVALHRNNDPFNVDNPGYPRETEGRRVTMARWVADLWQRFGFYSVHIRHVHYKILSQKDADAVFLPDSKGERYANIKRHFSYLGEAIRDARYLGLIAGDVVEDHRNAEVIINHPEAPESPANVETAEGGVRSSITVEPPILIVNKPIVPQRYHVEIWIEKSTMERIINPLGVEYGVNVFPGTGDVSLTRCLQLIERAKKSGLPVRILYICDFDPQGDGMPVGVSRKIEFEMRKQELDLDIQVRHVGLTREQCEKFDLPDMPTDDENWMARKGGKGKTELDALEAIVPGELERMLREEIERYIDPTLAGKIDETTATIQRDIDAVSAEVHERHAPTLAELETGRQIILAAIAALEARAAPIMQQIAEELAAEAPNADDYDWPSRARARKTTIRSTIRRAVILQQIDRYKKHQGKPTEGKPITRHEKICAAPGCGKTFTSIRRDAIACSKKCTERLSNFKRKQKRQGT